MAQKLSYKEKSYKICAITTLTISGPLDNTQISCLYKWHSWNARCDILVKRALLWLPSYLCFPGRLVSESLPLLGWKPVPECLSVFSEACVPGSIFCLFPFGPFPYLNQSLVKLHCTATAPLCFFLCPRFVVCFIGSCLCYFLIIFVKIIDKKVCFSYPLSNVTKPRLELTCNNNI